MFARLNVQLGGLCSVYRMTHFNVASQWFCITREAEWTFITERKRRGSWYKKYREKLDYCFNSSFSTDHHNQRNTNIFPSKYISQLIKPFWKLQVKWFTTRASSFAKAIAERGIMLEMSCFSTNDDRSVGCCWRVRAQMLLMGWTAIIRYSSEEGRARQVLSRRKQADFYYYMAPACFIFFQSSHNQ